MQKTAGTVRRKAEQAIQPASTEPAVAHIHSLIWSSQREVLLLAKEDDTHAYALADIIEEKGGHAVVLTDDLAKAGPLSRALLGTQLLIVCGDANIPMTEQTSFALDTMLRAGGACWIVGRTEYAPLASRATVFRRIPSYALDTVLNCD